MPQFDGARPSVRAMYTKLVREQKRVARKTNKQEQLVDHSVNFAMTAWHLVDWVWKLHFQGDSNAQAALRKKPVATVIDIDPPLWFKQTILEECPELRYCREVCNGTRQIALDRGQPVIQQAAAASLSATDTSSDRHQASAVYGTVVDYWKSFFDEHGIA